MTINDILDIARIESLLLEIEVLICDYLNLTKAQLFLNKENNIELDIFDKLIKDLDNLKLGYPLAYIRGKKEFFGLDFYVDENVLIPRPDTELLVNESILCIKNLYKNGGVDNNKNVDIQAVNMLEIGTGSGNISISILDYFRSNFEKENIEINSVMVEKSAGAQQIAAKNIEKYGLNNRAKLIKGDLLNNIDNNFDILIANLPYIAYDGEVDFNVVSFEPKEALFADDCGLKLYFDLLQQICEKGFQPKYILFEIGYDQGGKSLELFPKYLKNYKLEIIKDLENRDRVVRFTLI